MGERLQTHDNKATIAQFLQDTVLPAFEGIKRDLEKRGATVRIRTAPHQREGYGVVTVVHVGHGRFRYEMRVGVAPNDDRAYGCWRQVETSDGRAEDGPLTARTFDEVVDDFTEQYSYDQARRGMTGSSASRLVTDGDPR
jgi:hypothetical protein